MKIIICGAGQVGFNIARHLAMENNDVTVIDQSPELIRRVNDSLDAQGVVGHASRPDVLERAGAEDSDMIIAVTQGDETNMVACQVAHSLFEVPIKIARVRHQSYLDPAWANLFSRDHMPIDVIISPEIEVARAVSRRLKVPGAFEMIPLVDDKVRLLGVRCDANCPLVDTPLKQLTQLFPDLNLVVVGLLRDNHPLKLSGSDHMIVGDDVYFVVETSQLPRAMAAFGHEEPEAKRLLICGGGNIALLLAQEIEQGNVRSARYAKLERKQRAKTERLSTQLEAIADTEDEVATLTIDTPLDEIELTAEQKAEASVEAAAFGDRLGLGDGRGSALSAPHEALMPGSVVSTNAESVYLHAELPEGAGEENVVKKLTQTRERYDFAVSVTRLDLEVEKKVIVTKDGERRVVSASTAQYGPPRFSVTWGALATLAVMVGQFAMPLNRLATMLSTSLKRFTTGSLSRMTHYVATRFLPVYLQLCDELADSAILAGDDTSCRVVEVSSYFARQPSTGERAPPPWTPYRTAADAEQTYASVSQAREELLARRADGEREAKGTPLKEPSLSLLIGREFTFESPRRDGRGPKQSLNTTVLTGRSDDDDPGSMIVLYRSHLGSFGNLLEMVLRKRKASARELWVQSDLSTTNLVTDPALTSRFDIAQAGCTSHARRPFAQYEDQDPIRAPYVLLLFKGLAMHEDCLDRVGRNRENVLAVRQKDSLPLWEKIKAMARDLVKVWTKATPLGVGARYIIKHFDELTAYLRDPRLEATNNLRERLLRTEKLIEKSSMFRQTIEGRAVLDILRTILQTAVAAGVPAQEYLVDVMRADPDEVAEQPERYTPLAWLARQAAEQA